MQLHITMIDPVSRLFEFFWFDFQVKKSPNTSLYLELFFLESPGVNNCPAYRQDLDKTVLGELGPWSMSTSSNSTFILSMNTCTCFALGNSDSILEIISISAHPFSCRFFKHSENFSIHYSWILTIWAIKVMTSLDDPLSWNHQRCSMVP